MSQMKNMLTNNPNTDLHKESLGKWYSWIPTNIGYLNFNYIADRENLDAVFGKDNYFLEFENNHQKKITIIKTYLSDSNPLVNKILDKKEFYPVAYLEFNRNMKFNHILDKYQPNSITGKIILSFEGIDPDIALEDNSESQPETKEYKKISAEFTIERTGKLCIENVQYIIDSQMHVKNIDDTKLPELTALYTLINKVVHGDNHHFQKIDTMIGIYKEFVPKQILTDLGFHIKRLDKFLKNESNDIGMILFSQDKEKISSYAKGFKSYIDTFNTLFNSELETTTLKSEENYFITYQNIDNTIKSIEAKSDSLKIVKNFSHNLRVLIFTLLGFFISANILISSLAENYYSEGLSVIQNFINRDYLIVIMFLIILYFLRHDILAVVMQVIRKKISAKDNYNYLEYFIISNYLMEDIKKEVSSRDYIQTYLKVTNSLVPTKNKIIGFAILLIFLGIYNLIWFGI
jgi:hypothetical protein